ncbi:uncharacterized protein HMPREF1541_06347 [Cyphellophora europaea CBS 101466]|uniref:Uncharacterized protein n=1 Tax=Cyphellophora europaea (strain CBS 101466) TaxID=1220924 RepID=W2RRG3_CYPE1|nr:uncharacterized protein HMPREF1541_06347 [Cyphellophora europaea CBS 101466]ETN38313.1 hypothetical protein HMPREF1541_06347 [Cyphellophora europaea CBS 101466]
MSAGNASGGVRNLRAMFENKTGDQSNSPPSRGRSPSGSVASTNSRPVSKVRASFVAVERSGEQGQLWGLRKASDVSSMAEVKENESSLIDGAPLATTHTTPEKGSNGGLGQILKGSSFSGTPMKEKPNEMESVKQKGKGPQKPTSTDDHSKQPKTNGVAARGAEAARTVQDKVKPSTAKPNPKPIETKGTAPAKPDKQSPRTPTSAGIKPRGGVAKIKGVMDSAKKAAEGREATKKADAAKAESAPESPAKTNGHKGTVHSPRATTKPVKLPSAATAPTAASAAHLRSEPEPQKKPVHSSKPAKLPSAVTATTAASAAHDRALPEAHAKKPTSRRASAAHSSHPRLSTTGTQASLAKKASRASLAERPQSRTSHSKPDDGFLARMMRPTQASSQKTHDKVQVTSPPRGKPAAPKAKSAPRASLGGRSHHDHVDPAGDYADESPSSPTVVNRLEPAVKAPVDEKAEPVQEIPETVLEEDVQPEVNNGRVVANEPVKETLAEDKPVVDSATTTQSESAAVPEPESAAGNDTVAIEEATSAEKVEGSAPTVVPPATVESEPKTDEPKPEAISAVVSFESERVSPKEAPTAAAPESTPAKAADPAPPQSETEASQAEESKAPATTTEADSATV